MTKAQALLNFQAVTNYLMWQYSCPLYLEIKQEVNYFQLEMHFEPEELPVDSLRCEINHVRCHDSNMEFKEIEGYTTIYLRIRWRYI